MIDNKDISLNKPFRQEVKSGSTFIGDNADIAVMMGLTLVTLLFIYVPFLNHGIIRLALGFATILFVPGYTFIAALYPRKDDIGGLERAVLSVGLSIILVPFIGFLLNYTTWGIHLGTMVLFVTLLIFVCSAVAWFRRRMLPGENRFRVDLSAPVEGAKKLLLPASKEQSDKVISVLMICSLALLLSILAYVAVMPYQPDKFTEFYIYGPEGNISNYPITFAPGDKKPVIVGISNHEGGTRTYDLSVMLSNESEAHRIYLDHLVIEDNQTVEKVVNLSPDRAGDMQNIRFLLYMDGSPADPYRECNLWVNVTDTSANASVVNATDTNATIIMP